MFAVFKPARKAALAAVTAAATLALAACDTVPGSGGPSINTNKPVPVALLVPRGSQSSGDQALAQSLENAARLAMGDLTNVQIDLRVYDTAGSAEVAAGAATQAINEGARILLGPVYAEAANAAGIAAAKKNVNILAFSNNPAIAGGNVFILGSTFDNKAERLAGFAARQGKGNMLVVAGGNAAGQAGQAAIISAASRTGANIAGVVSYQQSQQGVIGAISDIKGQAAASGASSIFMTATTAGALPLLTQLLPEAGVKPEEIQYMGLTRWDIPAQTLALPGVQGGWFTLPDPVKSQGFKDRYAAAYGSSPHPIGGLAYDGIAAIGALVGQGKSDALTGAALTQSAGYQGVNGIFRLRGDGTNERGLAVATIQEQKVVVIDPAPTSFSGAGF
jgi:hypothetical protein